MYKWLSQVFRGSEEGGHPQRQDDFANHSSSAQQLKEMGDKQMSTGDYAAAEACYRKALAIQPDLAGAHCHLGFLLRASGRLDEALQSLKAAVDFNAGEVDAHFMLGLIYREKGDREAAVPHFHGALQASPTFEPAYVELLNVFTELEKASEFRALLDIGIEKLPGSPTLNFLLAKACFDASEFDAAIKRFKQTLIHDPAYADAWIMLANYARFNHSLNKAQRYLRTALEIDPNLSGLMDEFQIVVGEIRSFEETAMLVKARNVVSGKKKVRLVCATRAKLDDFISSSFLGQSTTTYGPIFDDFELQLFAENTNALSVIYNRAIEYAKLDPAILVFIHDDAYLSDFFWMDNIREALDKFDIVGVAGNTRRVLGQVAWCFLDTQFTTDEFKLGVLSGMIGADSKLPGMGVANFGPSKRECKLLDGVFLAADSEKMHDSGLRFDENFKFHFYDLDFCRQAELKNLRMGTWPISIIHASAGNFRSPSWWDGLRKYREKYGE